ncbi:MAG: hypothetical protein QXN59_00735 [Candidatus Micrarchaeaceae archaeon]
MTDTDVEFTIIVDVPIPLAKVVPAKIENTAMANESSKILFILPAIKVKTTKIFKHPINLLLVIYMGATKSKRGKSIIYASIAIELVSALYLLLFDRLLYSSGILHWFGLLIYILITIILALGIAGYLRGSEKSYYKLLGAISILAAILFILDAAFGLPFTKFDPGINISSGIGWSYLFGFGAKGTPSFFSTSLAFTILLIFSIVTGALSLYKARQ